MISAKQQPAFEEKTPTKKRKKYKGVKGIQDLKLDDFLRFLSIRHHRKLYSPFPNASPELRGGYRDLSTADKVRMYDIRAQGYYQGLEDMKATLLGSDLGYHRRDWKH